MSGDIDTSKPYGGKACASHQRDRLGRQQDFAADKLLTRVPGQQHKVMKRRAFVRLLGGAAAWPVAALARPSSKAQRVAYLSFLGDEDAAIVRQRLNELGYIEGKNLIFDLRSAAGE